jgi:hypothetical protein
MWDYIVVEFKDMICGNKRIEMTQKWVPKEELNYSGRRI